MKDGFIKVGTCSPHIHLADPKYNADLIIQEIKAADKLGVRLLVFPELCICGYTMGDLFMHETLLDTCRKQLLRIKDETKECGLVSVIGAPILFRDKVYNCAVVLSDGEFVGIVPKMHLPNYGEFYEMRHFTPATEEMLSEGLWNSEYACIMGLGLVFECMQMSSFRFGVEICEDLWVSNPPSNELCRRGALMIANCSAGDEIIGKADYRKDIVQVQSAKNITGYIYCGAGEGESTSDMVFSGHSFIFENGYLLNERPPFDDCADILVSEIDVSRLLYDRRRINSFENRCGNEAYVCEFSIHGMDENELCNTSLTRNFARNPFVPEDKDELHSRARDILMIQAMGLKRRVEHTHSKSLVIGISGGLDSSLALLAAVKACDLMGVDRGMIHAVTMPCFGTTEHTKNNAVELCRLLGVTLHTVQIAEAVRQHFKDILHDESNHNVVYENAQARMRTLVLMNMANSLNGLVIGTGDLSELALGWATYNGDHMSMYGLNAGIPKTLVRYVVRFYAMTCGNESLKDVLISILETPISPELLPADDAGNIAQKTEDLVGPYELHDFFLYYVLRWGFAPAKLYRVAKAAFAGSEFDEATILKWLKNFYRRFFNQQFKRNCLPDGPKVGSVCLSPRGDWRMPSDAFYRIWKDELEKL